MRTGPGRSGPAALTVLLPRAARAVSTGGRGRVRRGDRAAASGVTPRSRARGAGAAAPQHPRSRAVPASPLAAAAQRPAGSGPAAENGVRASLPRLAPRPAPQCRAMRDVIPARRDVIPARTGASSAGARRRPPACQARLGLFPGQRGRLSPVRLPRGCPEGLGRAGAPKSEPRGLPGPPLRRGARAAPLAMRGEGADARPLAPGRAEGPPPAVPPHSSRRQCTPLASAPPRPARPAGHFFQVRAPGPRPAAPPLCRPDSAASQEDGADSVGKARLALPATTWLEPPPSP